MRKSAFRAQPPFSAAIETDELRQKLPLASDSRNVALGPILCHSGSIDVIDGNVGSLCVVIVHQGGSAPNYFLLHRDARRPRAKTIAHSDRPSYEDYIATDPKAPRPCSQSISTI